MVAPTTCYIFDDAQPLPCPPRLAFASASSLEDSYAAAFLEVYEALHREADLDALSRFLLGWYERLILGHPAASTLWPLFERAAGCHHRVSCA